jgi:hypothetical protein
MLVGALAALCWMIAGCAAPRPLDGAQRALAAEPLPTETLPLGYTPLPFLHAPTRAPTPEPTAAPTPEPAAPTLVAAEPYAQYARWIEEARRAHPYPEAPDHMLRVMLCESSGNAAAIAGPYHGLFQYLPSTWSGDWNPYRDQPILDARAQIFATAKAWQDGYQSWWGCYQAPS